jgi:hypothetical protein
MDRNSRSDTGNGGFARGIERAFRAWETVVFSHESGAFLLDIANKNDVSELAQLNSSVKLDMTRYERVLSQDEAGFAQRGGFFEVMSAEDIERCMDSGRSVIFVLRDVSSDVAVGRGFAAAGRGPIVTSLWVSLDDPGFDTLSPEFTRYLDEHPALASALTDGRVCYGRELIVARDAPRFMSPSMAVFSGSFHTMRSGGFDYALSEVYRVAEYRAGTKVFDGDITNEAALCSVAEAGGLHIARNNLRTLDFDGELSVTIEPLIVLFDFAITLRRLDRKLSEQGAMTTFSDERDQRGREAQNRQSEKRSHV